MAQALKIMVVDDSHTIRKTAQTLLSKEGHTVICIEDGFEALTKVAEIRPDIIFMDVMMPRLDGYDTCQIIKASPDFKDTPIVMLSSKDGVFDKVRGRISGSVALVSKPFSKDDLVEAIQTYL